MSQGKVDIGFKADVADLKNKLAAVSGITDKEAKAMVTSLQRAYSASERAAKKAAQQNSMAWTETFSKVALAGMAIKNVIGPTIQWLGAQANLVDQIGDLGAKTQVSNDNIQALQMAFEQTGLEFSNVEGLLSKFTATLGKAAVVGGKAQKGFDLLKIETRDSLGVMRDSNEVFEEAIQKIGDLKTPTEQAAAATALFGAEGQNLLVAFGDLSNFETYLKISKEYGLDVGPEATKAAAEWETATYSLSLAFKKAGADLFKAFGTDGTTALKLFSAGVAGAFAFVSTIIGEMVAMWKNAFGTLGDFFDKVKNGTASLSDVGDALSALSKFTPLNIVELPRIMGLAGDNANRAADGVFTLNWSLNNIAQSSKETEQNLGSVSKKIKEFSSVLEELAVEPIELVVPDKSVEFLEEQTNVLSDLTNQYQQNAIAQLGPAEQIRANLQNQLRSLDAIAAANQDNLAIQEMVNGLKAQADLQAKNQLLDIQAQKIEEIKNAQQQRVLNAISNAQGGLSGIATMIGGPIAAAAVSAFMNIRETITGLKEELLKIPDIFKELPRLLVQFAPEVFKEIIPAIIQSLPDLVIGLVAAVPSFIEAIVDSIPIIISSLIEAVPQIIYGVINQIPKIIVALVSAIPEVAKALIDGMISFWKDGVFELARSFWEALKDIFIPSELFDKDKNTTTRLGDTLREIFTLGKADTNTYNDTPGVIRAGASGAQMRFAAGDYVAAAKTPKDLLRQAIGATGAKEAVASSGSGSGSAFVDWSHGAFAYDSFSRRLAGKKGRVLRQIYGAVA